MKWFADYKHPKDLNFIIDEDKPTGFYIYMYQNMEQFKKDLYRNDDRCTHFQDDYLQDTLEIAKRCALRVYGVPIDVWKQVA
ncbi:MAG: hypothetical protein HY052_02470 [Proteobacteria bacterium]|nr:hypothetical protein [Pseudomonadota bacterium]